MSVVEVTIEVDMVHTESGFFGVVFRGPDVYKRKHSLLFHKDIIGKEEEGKVVVSDLYCWTNVNHRDHDRFKYVTTLNYSQQLVGTAFGKFLYHRGCWHITLIENEFNEYKMHMLVLPFDMEVKHIKQEATYKQARSYISETDLL